MSHAVVLAPYAADPANSRGRVFAEGESKHRTAFQRDRDRVIHSTAFRRLEYKTQVFVNHEGDHYRTRLTHTLEVSQLARTLARALHLNEDLAEAVALAHDLGHPPFGHAGEDGLREAMRDFGGFDHNAQTIRILTTLEQKYAEFDGLNLTWETLEGIAKHNGPLLPPRPSGERDGVRGGVPRAMAEYCAVHDLELHTWPSAEAQIASLADDIAYGNHDLDDGLRAGLFTLDALVDLPLAGDALRAVRAKYPRLDGQRLGYEITRRVMDDMTTDLLATTAKNLAESGAKNADEIRALGRPVAAFSPDMAASNRALKTFLFDHMYRHYRVNRMASKARRVVQELFAFFVAEPECLPTAWRLQAEGVEAQKKAEVVADFIAGMTDRFAMDEYKRVFDMSART